MTKDQYIKLRDERFKTLDLGARAYPLGELEENDRSRNKIVGADWCFELMQKEVEKVKRFNKDLLDENLGLSQRSEDFEQQAAIIEKAEGLVKGMGNIAGSPEADSRFLSEIAAQYLADYKGADK